MTFESTYVVRYLILMKKKKRSVTDRNPNIIVDLGVTISLPSLPSVIITLPHKGLKKINMLQIVSDVLTYSSGGSHTNIS